MSRTRIKICGLRHIDQLAAVVAAGADAVGLVFYAASPRAVDLQQASQLVRSLPPFVTPVGLFVDASVQEVEQTLAVVPLGLLQFHGDEPAEYCSGFGLPYIKAIKIAIDGDAEQAARQCNEAIESHPDAQGFLLDSAVVGTAGGTGRAFDWQQVPSEHWRRVILAGGLDAGNVAGAIAQYRPYAVDVSSGVESVPGEKDAGKVREFVEAVRRADAR